MKPKYMIDLDAEVEKYFVETSKLLGSDKESTSPSKRFKAAFASFKMNKPDSEWIIRRASLYRENEDIPFRKMISNYKESFHQWLEKDGVEYFLLAEDVFGGQSILDLNSNKIERYFSSQDGYIITEYNLSPNKDILIVFGCEWAMPYRLKVFDFRNPMSLPWSEINCETRISDDEDFGKWIGPYTFEGTNGEGEKTVIHLEEECQEYFKRNPIPADRVSSGKNA